MSNLVCYGDADFSGDRDKRKFTTGWALLLEGGAVIWCRKKQRLTSQSTVEAEFISQSFSTCEVIWIRKLVLKTGSMSQGVACDMRVDNQGCLAIAKTDRLNERTKHIDVKFYLVKDKVKDGTIFLQYVPSAAMAAEIFDSPTGFLTAS